MIKIITIVIITIIIITIVIIIIILIIIGTHSLLSMEVIWQGR